MVSEVTIRTAIAAKIATTAPAARVHRRFRYPKQEQLAEYKRLFADTSNRIHTYMIRRTRRTPTMHGIPRRLVSVALTYEVSAFFVILDDDDPLLASEEIFQAELESLATTFEADATLGLGPSIAHAGFIVSDIQDGLLGGMGCLHARAQLVVTAQNAC